MKNKLLISFKTLLISLILISCSENNKLENVNKILLFGDSLMSGYGLKEDQTLSIILENDLKEAVEFLIYQGADPHIMDL